MTKEKLWLIYIEKYPAFLSKNLQVNLTGAGLKRLFETTFAEGYKEGVKQEATKKSTFENLFGTGYK